MSDNILQELHHLFHPKNIAVVGYGAGGHLFVFYFLYKVFQKAGTVKKTVLGVNVQMDEIGMEHVI